MHQNNVQFIDVQGRIDEEISRSANTIRYNVNENRHYCCRLCNETIRDINYVYVYLERNHIDRNIETLVCGLNCPGVQKEKKSSCNMCGVIVDIGYMPVKRICDDCNGWKQPIIRHF